MAEQELGPLGLLDGEGELFIPKVVIGADAPARPLSSAEVTIRRHGGRALYKAEQAMLWKVRP